MNRLQKLVAENGGVENFRCFAICRKFDLMTPFGFGLSSDRNSTWAECRISENRYQLEEGYKITLVPLDLSFASEDYYQEDVYSMFQSGHMIVKTSEAQHVEHIREVEYLCGKAYLYHDSDVVVMA